MEQQLMSLKVDFAFKELMNNEKVRKGFIAAVLNIPAQEIVSTTILNTYLRKEHQDDKLGILDVRVELNGNIEIDIEMQVVPCQIGYSQSASLLAPNLIAASQLVSRACTPD